jgi:hypothetical protein
LKITQNNPERVEFNIKIVYLYPKGLNLTAKQYICTRKG